MKVADLIEKRQPLWSELERLCDEVGKRGSGSNPDSISRFSTLYRAACADLALAESYQLPPKTVDYLHRLVARSHNQLYRSRTYRWKSWYNKIFVDTPRLIFDDVNIQIVTVIFWGLFLIAAFLAYDDTAWPGFAEKVVGEEQLSQMQEDFSNFGGNRGFMTDSLMAGFYIKHNAGIGLSCFVTMLFVIPGMVTLSFNAIHLGTSFGYMFRPDLGNSSQNFQHFVTAHGPFELTAIILSAGAGLKIGMSWITTGGLNRVDSLVKTARETLPIVMCATILFCMAAMIEGFISPSGMIPWWIKGTIAVGSSCMLMIYFVVLGYPREGPESDPHEI